MDERGQVEQERRPTRRVMLKYALLQLPGLGLLAGGLVWLQQAYALSAWFVVLPCLVWVAKDALLFPWLWRAFDDRPSARTPEPLELVGVVTAGGQVRVRGELWRAEPVAGGPPLQAGQRVRVRRARGLTLFVEAEGEEPPP
ncbi:MAG TPA: NfeD family protein [Myxococcota bacterium]|nr:NfeD family protein [Myxococcota bacterium]HRY95859.1 NfeD family protein [Myxococcota bacterium]HSA23856.1 NfeD family protein [Myxococcota bacterium]